MMQTKVGGTWRKLNPQVKVSGVWRPAKEAWVKVEGAWRDISIVPEPILMDLKTRPEWNYYYGTRLSYVPYYDPPGECIPNNLNLYNSSITVSNFEIGSNDEGYPGGAWQWLTIVMPGDQSGLPWPRLGSFAGIPLHFVSVAYVASGNSTRVWYRSWTPFPQENSTYKQLRI